MLHATAAYDGGLVPTVACVQRQCKFDSCDDRSLIPSSSMVGSLLCEQRREAVAYDSDLVATVARVRRWCGYDGCDDRFKFGSISSSIFML